MRLSVDPSSAAATQRVAICVLGGFSVLDGFKVESVRSRVVVLCSYVGVSDKRIDD
jgi:hypothetical protein